MTPTDRYLPAPPTGWVYGVTLYGPDGERFLVSPTRGSGPVDDGRYWVESAHDEDASSAYTESLRDGVTAALRAARAADQVRAAQAALTQAKRAATAALGEADTEESG